jgi:predicted glycoside hydrolase/deacetylase ChbG (UPF0249 family)
MTEFLPMAKEVVFVADDLGMSAEVNDAILHAHCAGRLDGAALMMGQAGTHDAVRLARANPSLQIGWHVHLTDSQPVTTDRWPWGTSPARAGWAVGLLPSARRLMENEVARQWELFQSTGLACAFVNSHHHLHAHPFVYHAMRRVIGKTSPGWLRLGRPCFFSSRSVTEAALALGDQLFMNRRRRLSPWRTTDTLWGLDRLFRMDPREVRAALAGLPEGFHEFLFHPRTRTCPDTQCLLALKSS